jgi:protein ImuB
VNDAAARLGLTAGMALADAKAMYPALTVADAEPQADARLLATIADWCDRYTPLIGLDPPDGLMLDITGCAHLFGGEAALGRDIVRRLAQQGLAARVAVADTAGCAWAVARFRAAPVLMVVASSGTREALLPLQLAALRIAPEVQDALAQVGLKRIADVIDRPRAPLAARFGQHFIRRIDQALGREEEPISPRLPVPSCVAERRFAEQILLEADVLGTIELLAHELARILERRGEGARRLAVALFRTDGKVARAEIGTGTPLRDPIRIRALFVERIAAAGDIADPGFGFDVIRLAALATERCDPAQTGLAAADHSADLAHLIDRLGARFGLHRITRLAPQDTHVPEFAVAAIPAAEVRGQKTENRAVIARVKVSRNRAASLSPPPCGEGLGVGVVVVAGGRSSQNNDDPPPHPSPTRGEGVRQPHCFPLSSDSIAPTRPIRLFSRPELIEAMAEVPDGPPVRFRWRQVLHQVAHAEGPERIAMEWWRDEKGRVLTRDYFRIESENGVRAWLYREGLYGREQAPPRWFLHGLFA